MPPLGAKTATEIINAVPVKGGYGPFKELAISGPIGPGAPKSGIRIDGNTYIATAAGVYYNGAQIEGGAPGIAWEFERWGNYIAAVSSLGVFRGIAGVLTHVPGSPGGRLVRRVKDFLVIGRSDNPHFLHWSAINDMMDFAPSKTRQADLNDMGAQFGAVMGIAGEESPFVLQERSISRMTYAGPPVIFSFLRVSDDRGCISKGSVINTPFGSGFFSQDGPNVILGDEIRQISKGSFQRWFASNFNPAWPVSAGYDWREKTIVWAWDEGTRRRGLAYSVTQDRATLIEDAPALLLNDGNLAFGVDVTGRVGTFTGPNARATLTTGESQMEPQRRAFAAEIWPVVDAQIKSASVGVRDGQTVTYSPEYEANSAGMVPCRVSAHNHRFKTIIPRGQDWQFAQGVQVGFRPEGRQ
jgi:hypothetical protein